MKYHDDGSRPLFGQIFVFGSNLAGIHGAGAAKAARLNYGARLGVGIGITGHSYALPTKDGDFGCLSLDQIKEHVDVFVEYTKTYPTTIFFITRVGCGLAGNADADIAPMFKGCGDNCSFAGQWREYLG